MGFASLSALSARAGWSKKGEGFPQENPYRRKTGKDTQEGVNTMGRTRGWILAALVILGAPWSNAFAHEKVKATVHLKLLDLHLCGTIVDKTNNHGCDNRI
jgi:hypothetical protein